MQCNNNDYACYVIDNNGYILLSNNTNDTGRFFGEIEDSAMRELLKMRIFKDITVYDFQAVCKKPVDDGKSATSFATILVTVKDYLLFVLFVLLCNYFV